MNTMQEAMVKAGLVSKTHAQEVEIKKEVDKVLKEDRQKKATARSLRNELDSLIKRSKGMDPIAVSEELTRLSRKYPDEFDKVATEFAYGLNLPDLRANPRLP